MVLCIFIIFAHVTYNNIYIYIMKSELLKILLKVIVYACGLLLAYLGVSACVSCTVQREMKSSGSGVGIFHYSDTFRVDHGRSTTIKVD